MKTARKLTAIILVMIMALALCACGSSGVDESVCGTYTLYAMDLGDGTILSVDGFFEGENYITLKNTGYAEMCLDGQKATVKWKLTDTEICLTAADGDMEGKLANGILSLLIEGMNLYYVGEGIPTDDLNVVDLDDMLNAVADAAFNDAIEDLTTEQVPVAQEETEVQKMWNGWWYGAADINGCEGGWEWANGGVFDVVMYVELDADGNGKLGIYDPYGEMAVGPNNNRFATINCHADTLYLYGDSGTSFGYDINASDWRVVHNLAVADKLNVGSSYVDADGNKFGYDFMFMPWGSRWEGDNYTQFIPHFDEYLAWVDAGKENPFDLADPFGTGVASQAQGPEQTSASAPEPSANSELLGSSPEELDINGKGVVYVYYPADQFIYDDDYCALKNYDAGVNIYMDPMLGSNNYAELKASYEEHNSGEDDYSLTETTINGYKAMIMTYSDWLGATMRVDIDFGGNHDGYYGMSFSAKGDTLAECDTDLVWAIINSMTVAK